MGRPPRDCETGSYIAHGRRQYLDCPRRKHVSRNRHAAGAAKFRCNVNPERNDIVDTLPNPATDETTRFESAPDPDGTLIPIPTEAPRGSPIREDANITVSPRRDSGYYVAIYNGPPNPPSEIVERITETLTDAGLEVIEEAVLEGAPAALTFGLSVVGILASVFTTSPLLAEQYLRGTMDDGTQVTYAVLTPKQT